MKNLAFYIALIPGVMIALSGCRYFTPANEDPLRTIFEVEKTRFVKPTGEPRTFLAGWASVNQIGSLAHTVTLHNFSQAFHCNVEFEITESQLIGRLVNPSKPGEFRDWQPVIKIPIKQHFYLEPAKDQYNRDTSKIIKNSTRSDPLARPWMELDFSRVSIENWSYALTPPGVTTVPNNVYDVEWDQEKGFIAFTLSVSVSTGWPNYATGQVDYRFNFKEFEHDENFEITPYDSLNGKHINVLHVFGRRKNGGPSRLYAGKWDLTERHDIYLINVPSGRKPQVEEAIKLWNEAFIEIGALDSSAYNEGKAGFFPVSGRELKYSFDLRYPAITWVTDKEVCYYSSAAGISISASDLRNGKMLWGQVNIYAANLEDNLRYFLPSGDALGSDRTEMDISEVVPRPGELLYPEGFSWVLGRDQSSLSNSLTDNFFTGAPSPVVPGGESGKILPAELLEKLGAPVTGFLKPGDLPYDLYKKYSKEIEEWNSFIAYNVEAQKDSFHPSALKMADDLKRLVQFTKTDYMRELGQTNSLEWMNLGKYYAPVKNDFLGNGRSAFSPEDVRRLMAKMGESKNGMVTDLHDDIKDIAPSFRAMTALETIDEDEAIRTFYKELVLHEFGHFFGLGHNFKDNILPEQGTVPSWVYENLKSGAHREIWKSKEKKEKYDVYINASTVMGYRHPYATIATPEENIKPGLHDLHVLRYIYKKEYPVFDRKKDDYRYCKLEYTDGIIPGVTKECDEEKSDGAREKTAGSFELAYLPACNDGDATFSLDPLCARFDYGYDAKTIVDSCIKTLTDNRIHASVAAADVRGSNADLHEYYLALRSWRTLGRIRLFYDTMRRDYKSSIDKIRNDEDSLYEFSEACELENSKIKNPVLKEIFEAEPGLKELCAVNGKAIKAMTGFLSESLRDGTLFDFENRVMPGGIVAGDARSNYGRAIGTWKILTNLPLKIAALGTLTSPRPFWVYNYYSSYSGSNRFMLVPVATYSADLDAGYSYSTLYPRFFTEAISKTVANNLEIFRKTGDYSTMGRAVLNLGHFLYQDRFSNDAPRFSESVITNVRSQPRFNFSLVAVMIAKVSSNPQRKDLATRFEASLFDWRTGGFVGKVDDIFVLPDGELIIKAENKFIHPITEIKFYSDSNAYAFAYMFDYLKKSDDQLFESSVKKTLKEINDEFLDDCIKGFAGNDNKKNGLQEFFGTEKFKGFKVPEGIALDSAKQDEFLDSIQKGFDEYYAYEGFSLSPDRDTCLEAKRGMGLIVSTAAVLNGMWIPELIDFVRF